MVTVSEKAIRKTRAERPGFLFYMGYEPDENIIQSITDKTTFVSG
jgi:hypothetical protein